MEHLCPHPKPRLGRKQHTQLLHAQRFCREERRESPRSVLPSSRKTARLRGAFPCRCKTGWRGKEHSPGAGTPSRAHTAGPADGKQQQWRQDRLRPQESSRAPMALRAIPLAAWSLKANDPGLREDRRAIQKWARGFQGGCDTAAPPSLPCLPCPRERQQEVVKL